MVEGEAVEAMGRRFEGGDAVEDDAPGHPRDRELLGRRAGEHARALPRATDREGDAVLTRARLEDGEIELDHVPAREDVGIDPSGPP